MAYKRQHKLKLQYRVRRRRFIREVCVERFSFAYEDEFIDESYTGTGDDFCRDVVACFEKMLNARISSHSSHMK